MNRSLWVASLVVAASLLGGCSTRPREFDAVLKTPAVDQELYVRDFATCRLLAIPNGRAKPGEQVAHGAAVGTGAVATAGAASVASLAGTAGVSAASAAASATVVALPLVGGAALITKAVRSGRERRIKTAMGQCMTQYGYEVVGWNRPGKGKAIKGSESRAEAARAAAQAKIPKPEIVK